MGGRYYITGVQLGLLVSDHKEARLQAMQEIIDNQFIGNTDGTKEEKELIKKIEEFSQEI